MILGEIGGWADRFKRYDERLLERICMLLPACITALGENPKEDEITINLVSRFHLDPVVRRLFHHWEFQFEPSEIDENGAYLSKGKIDLALFWDLNREKYLAYEAKRLNVRTGKSTTSLATPYVTEGVARFVTEQYSKGLPVGCMLGYVLDGNVSGVHPKIAKALDDNKTLVGLIQGPNVLEPVSSAHRFQTDHNRKNDGGLISLRHALVPCVESTNSSSMS